MSNTFNDQCGFSLLFLFFLKTMAVHELLSDVSSNHSAFLLRCFHDDHDMPGASDRGREAGYHSLSHCAKMPSLPSVFSFCFWLRRTYCSYDNSCVPATVCLPRNAAVSLATQQIFLFFLNGGKFRARVWFKSLQRCLVFWCFWGLEIMSCLTIATTAAPAPARAQTNRWKVMSSCGEEKKRETDQSKHHYPSQCHASVSTVFKQKDVC